MKNKHTTYTLLSKIQQEYRLNQNIIQRRICRKLIDLKFLLTEVVVMFNSNVITWHTLTFVLVESFLNEFYFIQYLDFGV